MKAIRASLFFAAALLFFLPSGAFAMYYCQPHSYQQCLNNNIYWFDSCGNQQEIFQYCQNGCYGNICQNQNNYNYNICNYHAYRLCVGNNIYWFDSCGNQQDIYQSCYGTNMVCQYGQCVQYQPPTPVPVYVAHYSVKCSNSNLSWFDSLGASTGLYKSCADSNSCTIDGCSGKACTNVLKCDGSTCPSGSADFAKYCSSNNGGNTNTGDGVALAFFVKSDQNSTQWQKTIEIGQNSTVYFMITVKNNSGAQLNNANISANIPGQVASIGNLQLDDVAVPGDIVSGLNIGSLAEGATRTVTFEGKTQQIPSQSTNQANANLNVSGSVQSDSLSITFNPNQPASASSNPSTSGIMNFLKRWYLWILVAIVLVFLFVIVFRRLSSG